MKCSTAIDWIDRYYDKQLSPEARQQVDVHLSQCAPCAQTFEQHQLYRKSMASFKAPVLDSGRAANLLRQAALQGEHLHQHKATKRAFVQGFIAASVMALAIGLGVQQWSQPISGAEQAYVAHYGLEAQEIALVIHAPFEMKGAQLVLNLPADLSIQGQEHLATVTWAVDLKPGTNSIVLPVQFEPFAEFAEELILSASLHYQQSQKEFKVDLLQEKTANPQQGSAQLLQPQQQQAV